MPVVKYEEFRRLKLKRQLAIDSTMALIVASRMAAIELAKLPPSDDRLSTIYPDLPQAKRLDVRIEAAAEILKRSDEHLAAMAVPYVLALHEDYLMHCISMLTACGKLSKSKAEELTAKSMHETLSRASGIKFDECNLALFHVFRSLRNAYIHQGGIASDELCESRKNAPMSAAARWRRIADEPFPLFKEGQPFQLGPNHVYAALAVTNVLMVRANEGVARALPRADWLARFIEDAIGSGATAHGDVIQRFRSTRRFAKENYGPLGFTDVELVAAAKRAGVQIRR